jgi:hypothetical protein
VHALVVFATAAAVLLLGYRFDLTPWLEGIAFQRADVAAGHPAFLMGCTSDHGWWYAIPVALALKTPIALLLLLAAAALRLASQWDRSRWRAAAFLLLPALAVIGFFSLRQASIGLRYVLPAVPFLLVFASGVLAPVPRARPARAVLLGLLSWYVGASLFIHPHYLAYFNEIAGGPSRGYRLLVDSNLDWGQDLPGLAQFMRERGVESVHLSYFGSDAPARYGIRYDWLPSFELERPASQSETELPRRGWFAISATNLQGLYLPQPETFAWLREREPVAEIGYSIFVYHVE